MLSPSPAWGEPVKGVLFDLDDTLFEQRQWLLGAWQAVACAAVPYGAHAAELAEALIEISDEGSDQGGIIDRALERVGAEGCPVEHLVEVFWSFQPASLQPYAGAREGLRALRESVPIGLVTDGCPRTQRDKLRCLGLFDAFDVVVYSDELGREHRKPSALPFLAALSKLGVVPGEAVMVGDRPSKDVAGATAAGMRAVRALTGEYRCAPDDPPAWATVPDLAQALRVVRGLVGARAGTRNVAGAL